MPIVVAYNAGSLIAIWPCAPGRVVGLKPERMPACEPRIRIRIRNIHTYRVIFLGISATIINTSGVKGKPERVTESCIETECSKRPINRTNGDNVQKHLPAAVVAATRRDAKGSGLRGGGNEIPRGTRLLSRTHNAWDLIVGRTRSRRRQTLIASQPH